MKTTKTFKSFLWHCHYLHIIPSLLLLWIFGVILFIPTLGWAYELNTKWYDYWYAKGYFNDED